MSEECKKASDMVPLRTGPEVTRDAACETGKRTTILMQQRERRSRLIQDLNNCDELIKLLESDHYFAMKLEKVQDYIW